MASKTSNTRQRYIRIVTTHLERVFSQLADRFQRTCTEIMQDYGNERSYLNWKAFDATFLDKPIIVFTTYGFMSNIIICRF